MCEQALAQLKAALIAIVAEVIDYPAQRPYSSDSYLPAHLVEQATKALQSAGVSVGSLQVKGGAA
jgi:hypothetical protein